MIKWTGFVLALFLLAGCGDDSSGPDEKTLAAASVTTSTWRMAEAALLANSAALDGRRLGPSAAAGSLLRPAVATPAHDYGLECPDIELHRMPEKILVFVVYGADGCESQLTGETHSGYVQLDAGYDEHRAALNAHDWRSGDSIVNGEIGATYDTTSWVLDARNATVTGPAGTDTLTACMGISRDPGIDPESFSDDLWEIEGTASVTMPVEGTWQVEVVAGHPLVIPSSCAWPVRGEMTINFPSGGPTAIVDFGGGGNDNEVSITIGGESKTVRLPATGD